MQLVNRDFMNAGAFQSMEVDDEAPLFLVEETSNHYLIAIDIPSLPTREVRIREKKNEIFVEGIPLPSFLKKKTYFQFKSEARTCRTIYKDGVLWLVMPKYFVRGKNAANLIEGAS